jgi:hypothetical protein
LIKTSPGDLSEVENVQARGMNMIATLLRSAE